MDKQNYIDLAIARIFRAGDLLDEAQMLLNVGRYKSANNRAFYSVEKTMKALLTMEQVNSDTHTGILMQFNMHFIKEEKGKFEKGDYKKAASVERIRNNSDYDDFYIADKEECVNVVNISKEFYLKALEYMKEKDVLSDENFEKLMKYASEVE